MASTRLNIYWLMVGLGLSLTLFPSREHARIVSAPALLVLGACLVAIELQEVRSRPKRRPSFRSHSGDRSPIKARAAASKGGDDVFRVSDTS